MVSRNVQSRREEAFETPFSFQAPQYNVVTQLVELMPGISRLSPVDADLFREMFRKEALCYANSWLYLLRSARDDQGGLGYKFAARGMLAALGYRDSSFYIVRPMGAERFQALVDLCTQIYEHLPCPIILKKIDQELYEQLTATHLFSACTDDQELVEEEAFPEHILQLERLFAPTADHAQLIQPFLKKVRRFERSTKLWRVQHVTWEKLASNPGFQGLFGYRSDKYKSYAHVIKEASSSGLDDGRYKTCAYYDERGTVHGFYASEVFDRGIMGLYCAISSKSSPGITEWMDYDFFQQLFEEGTHTLYLGGSETAGVHAYVQKLLPVAPAYLMRPLQMYPGGARAD